MINKEEYERAYVEILEIFKYLPEEEVNKVPKKLIEQMEKAKKKHTFTLDRTKKINSQITDVSKAILANIYKEYWSTEYEKKVINAKENANRRKLEFDKMKKYPKQLLFQKRRK